MMKFTPFTFLFAFFVTIMASGCSAQYSAPTSSSNSSDPRIIPAAERLDQYLPLLKGKTVAVFANHTST
ncbi:MAG TPA: hypothetical protein VGD33_04625, partial [Chitinophagaceae bacterium]